MGAGLPAMQTPRCVSLTEVMLSLASQLPQVSRCSFEQGLDAQVIQDPFGGIAAFEDRRYHQVRTTNHVTTGEDFRVAGLVLVLTLFRRHNAALAVGLDAELFEPRRRACLLYTSPSPRDGLLSRMPSSA